MVQLKDTKNTITFDYTNYILVQKDLGYMDIEPVTYQYLNQVGLNFHHNIIGARHIVIEGWIFANSKDDMKIKKTALFNITNPTSKYQLIVDNYSLELTTENFVLSPNTLENNDDRCHFILYSMAANPLFYSDEPIIVPFGAASNRLIFPLHSATANPIIFGKSTPLTAEVINGGYPITASEIGFNFNILKDTDSIEILNTTQDITMFITKKDGTPFHAGDAVLSEDEYLYKVKTSYSSYPFLAAGYNYLSLNEAEMGRNYAEGYIYYRESRFSI